MKKVFSIILPILGLVSCFKSENRDLGVYNISDGYMRYQVNNFPFEMNGGYNSFSNTGIGVYGRKQLKSAAVPATRYVIIGQLSTRKAINMVIITDSLQTGTYTTNALPGALTMIKIDSLQYAGNRPEDVLSLKITRNPTGTVDGTFSGKLSAAKTTNSSTTYTDGLITNGVFKNVSIAY